MAHVEGYTESGDYIRTVSLVGPDGMRASVLTLGGRLLDLRLPDGRCMVLPLRSVSAVEEDGAYIGVAVGRTANRIRSGRLRLGRAVSADLELNENDTNHIHGGRRAWDKRLFSVRARGVNWVELYLFSPDGDQGYPSDVEVRVRYELRGEGRLHIDLETRNVGSTDTITNMTVHPYFDLSGNEGRLHDAVLNWKMFAPSCKHVLVLDNANLPTGEVADVNKTPFDFCSERTIGASLPDTGAFDNYLVVDGQHIEENSRSLQMQRVVSVTAEESNVKMDVETNQPGFQFYTAGAFDGSGPSGFERNGSFCVEPSGFIDAGNRDEFPSIALAPGCTKTQSVSYIFSSWRD